MRNVCVVGTSIGTFLQACAAMQRGEWLSAAGLVVIAITRFIESQLQTPKVESVDPHVARKEKIDD